MQIHEIRSIIKDNGPYISKRFRAQIVGIFGSYARGEENKDSDIDILVRFKEGATLFDLVELSEHLEELLGVPIDLVSERALHPMIKDEVFREMVVL
ncbi:MAG: nucleotidyltransferase family protein [Methanolobus sp.]|jgi:predicted nucleotidyltransferase|nr:nucleotidyltransferase family protein [Methanolobus sp.]